MSHAVTHQSRLLACDPYNLTVPGRARATLPTGEQPCWLAEACDILFSLMQAECGAVSSIDGRWRAMTCSAPLPTACRGPGGEWQLATGVRGTCPPGYTWQVPHHAKENMQLQMLLKLNAGPPLEAAWLPIQGDLCVCLCTASNAILTWL